MLLIDFGFQTSDFDVFSLGGGIKSVIKLRTDKTGFGSRELTKNLPFDDICRTKILKKVIKNFSMVA
jgi:hypothetical protein